MYEIDMLEGALRSRDNRIAELQAERDALTAHVEDGKLLVRELFVDAVTDDATHLTEWAEIESPATSLARLKAQWQAEALDHWLGLNLQGEKFEYLYNLRRQAEEGNHG